jgi:hypothetical protein
MHFCGETCREEAFWRAYKVIQKSPYLEKMVCLYMNPAFNGCHYVHSTYGCGCPTHGELAVTYVVLCAHMQLYCVRLDPYFVFLHLVNHGLKMSHK